MTTNELIEELKKFKKQYINTKEHDLAIIIGYVIVHLEELERDRVDTEMTCKTCPYQKFYFEIKEKIQNTP